MKVSIGPKTMALPTPTWLVGTYDADGKPNLMTAAWGGICCSKPPCLTVSLQKPRHSYAAIMERQAYTVSVPSESQAAQADYCGIVSGRDHDKFERLGWTPVRSELVDAPYVAECPLTIECKVVHVKDLGMHTLFVGEILDVKVDEAAMKEGNPDPTLIRPMIYSPSDRSYYGLGRLLGQGFSIGKEFK
ncbi:flavin reductase domain protein FMN-binding [Solidesulfovibrio carbinoliphilus subsp. oakridgensis]|uniref:Flavin reductase domain protein FMN-binding n=1 Tax=Solidesulfovibrio carbinoliphilus subsp. oakridgensis TaxID=694327 RepID=G7Q7Z8_9BACT|nr:flavin reductase family protein [Solidesulfovibrio carbinoliphilus]EHJ47692.1 flavin reductase domain protein FMN-binding [Solidesulfovibrio carbinoliphilus subsp. oakridgensis]